MARFDGCYTWQMTAKRHLNSTNFKDNTMQAFGNVATVPVRKISKSGKGYYEMRLAEAQRGIDNTPTFFTVRVMKNEDPLLDKGDFVKVTGKLKADFYIGRDGKPTGSLLIIAFEASKIAKPAALKDEPASKAPDLSKAQPCVRTSAPERVAAQDPQRPPESVRVTVEREEADWTTLYD